MKFGHFLCRYFPRPRGKYFSWATFELCGPEIHHNKTRQPQHNNFDIIDVSTLQRHVLLLGLSCAGLWFYIGV